MTCCPAPRSPRRRARRWTVSLALGALAVAPVIAAAPASANTGLDHCVYGGTPVRSEPGGAQIATVDRSQAWHTYKAENGWALGYISRTTPTQRGYVATANYDASRTPRDTPDGGADCP